MAIDDRELDQRLKDQLRMIEMGETLEDLNDPEEYEDEGGIRSLRKAPSIKMASETAEEEFQLELMGVINEYNDLKSKDDPAVRGISLDQYLDNYMSKKKMMEENRAMAMGGGPIRMSYADGMKNPKGNNLEDLPEGLKKDTTTYPLGQDPKFKDKKIIDISERLKKLMEEQEKAAVKKAKGGIAGVL